MDDYGRNVDGDSSNDSRARYLDILPAPSRRPSMPEPSSLPGMPSSPKKGLLPNKPDGSEENMNAPDVSLLSGTRMGVTHVPTEMSDTRVMGVV